MNESNCNRHEITYWKTKQAKTRSHFAPLYQMVSSRLFHVQQSEHSRSKSHSRRFIFISFQHQ